MLICLLICPEIEDILLIILAWLIWTNPREREKEKYYWSMLISVEPDNQHKTERSCGDSYLCQSSEGNNVTFCYCHCNISVETVQGAWGIIVFLLNSVNKASGTWEISVYQFDLFSVDI